MIVTFPHMGSAHVVFRTLFAGLGLKVAVPPPVTRRTLELGAAFAPEAACLPFKINLGNFIQAIEQGADTIITCGGDGPCRLGYYAEVQKNILFDHGYNADFVVIEPTLGSVWQTLKRLAPGRSWQNIYRVFRLAGEKITALDLIERQMSFRRPRVKNADNVDQLGREAKAAVDVAADFKEVGKAVEVFNSKLLAMETDWTLKPLKIGIVGEIYVMLEPFVNQELVARLGRIGVEVQQPILLGDYVETHILHNRAALRLNSTVQALAAPFISRFVGGHGAKSVGYTMKLGQAGFDGIVHVFPFTCMPEMIAKNILPQVSETAGIPVLSLTFDEQSGVAGMMTRLEAFADLLAFRRHKAEG